jgi:hypothetical protein
MLEEEDNGICNLTNWFGWTIQGVLAILAFITLICLCCITFIEFIVDKRHREVPKRSLIVWFFDTFG